MNIVSVYRPSRPGSHADESSHPVTIKVHGVEFLRRFFSRLFNVMPLVADSRSLADSPKLFLSEGAGDLPTSDRGVEHCDHGAEPAFQELRNTHSRLRCDCFIGYAHRRDLPLHEKFGDGLLARIPISAA